MNTSGVVTRARVARVTEVHRENHAYIASLTEIAQRGLPRMFDAENQRFAQTGRRSPTNGRLQPEGSSLRYAAIVALGASRLSETAQRQLFTGYSATQLADVTAIRALASPDSGVAALPAWASAEVSGTAPTVLFARVAAAVRSSAPLPTVDLAWSLTALLAARSLGDFDAAADAAADRLLAAQSDAGLFPHAVPAASLGRLRAHVGCFADQVYPIQALARYYEATGDPRAIAAANRCASHLVQLQGPAGQWWWHYDVRNGHVLEEYPVYSVHQHAMGPMALFELHEAGGHDYSGAVAHGLDWLRTHPETTSELVDNSDGVVWRKVGRREPRKAVRSVRAVAATVHPNLRLRAIDHLCRPGPVDYECRPYELGWLLYAWPAEGA